MFDSESVILILSASSDQVNIELCRWGDKPPPKPFSSIGNKRKDTRWKQRLCVEKWATQGQTVRRVQEEEDDVKSRPQVSQTEAPKSHNRLTRSCDTSNDPAAIHQICKQFSEGTACYIRALLVFPLCCLAKIVWTFDTRRTDILYPSFLKRQRAINQSWGGGDVETGGGGKWRLFSPGS